MRLFIIILISRNIIFIRRLISGRRRYIRTHKQPPTATTTIQFSAEADHIMKEPLDHATRQLADPDIIWMDTKNSQYNKRHNRKAAAQLDKDIISVDGDDGIK